MKAIKEFFHSCKKICVLVGCVVYAIVNTQTQLPTLFPYQYNIWSPWIFRFPDDSCSKKFFQMSSYLIHYTWWYAAISLLKWNFISNSIWCLIKLQTPVSLTPVENIYSWYLINSFSWLYCCLSVILCVLLWTYQMLHYPPLSPNVLQFCIIYSCWLQLSNNSSRFYVHYVCCPVRQIDNHFSLAIVSSLYAGRLESEDSVTMAHVGW